MSIMLLAIIKLVATVVLGFYIYRRKILRKRALSFLTVFVINFSIPLLIFSNIITHFQPNKMPALWIFISLSTGIFMTGLLLGNIFSFNVPKSLKKEFISLVSFQNCGYLPMTIAAFVFKSPLKETFLTYIFLYILGFNILMWSVASFLIFKKEKETFELKSIFTPPVLSVALSLIIVYMGLQKNIPSLVIIPARMIGKTSFILAMIILGAWLAKSPLKEYARNPAILKVVILKLIIIPFIILTVLIVKGTYSLLGLFILLEASMPSAASLPIITQIRKANSRFVSCGVFFTHVISIITVPIWIGLFSRITHFNLL